MYHVTAVNHRHCACWNLRAMLPFIDPGKADPDLQGTLQLKSWPCPSWESCSLSVLRRGGHTAHILQCERAGLDGMGHLWPCFSPEEGASSNLDWSAQLPTTLISWVLGRPILTSVPSLTCWNLWRDRPCGNNNYRISRTQDNGRVSKRSSSDNGVPEARGFEPDQWLMPNNVCGWGRLGKGVYCVTPCSSQCH